MLIHPLAYSSCLGSTGFLYAPHQGADLAVGEMDVS